MSEQDNGTNAPAPAEPEQVAVETQTEESAPQSDEAGQVKDAKPEPSPVQKRIDQLTWKAHESERRLNAEIQRRQEVEEEARKLREQQQELMRLATMPTMEDVEGDPRAYQKVLREHNERYLEAQRKEAHEAAERQRQMHAVAQFQSFMNSRIAEAQQKYNDYAEVVGNPSLPPLPVVNPPLARAIVENEAMADITYYLGKNPAEAHRIAALPPERAIMEVGKIAAKLSTDTARTKAPAPPSSVGGNQRASNGPSDSDSIEEWVRKREAQIRARR